MSVKAKTKSFVTKDGQGGAGGALKAARLELCLTQTELAERFSGKYGKKSQDAVSYWERTGKVPPEVVRRVGREVSRATRRALFEAAGIEDDTEGLLQPHAETHRIPVFLNPEQLGATDPIVDGHLSLPSQWFPQDANIKAAKFANRISPLFGDELIALVDIRYRDPDRLLNCIVVARTPHGNDAMRLSNDGGTFLLLPIGEGGDRTPRVVRSEGDWSILGKVVKWIGDAPSAAKK